MSTTATFEHYEVLLREDGSLFELGRGAMGITYKAFDSSLRIPVALKVINGTYLDSEVARQRFVREARAAAKLRHRHVASVFHLGTEGDTMFYAMEFIDGQTVEALIKERGPLAPKFALRIADQVARALNAAQAHGLVHRDIKPANLMLLREDDEMTVKVIDFGLAKSALAGEEDAAPASLAGFIGTPHFASPEQLREEEIDVRSDIYSLGVTLWFMLAGRTPFAGSMAQVMSQHLEKTPPFERLPDAPEPVAALLGRMLAKSPAGRPQTPAELRQQITRTLRALGEHEDESLIAAESFAAPPASALRPCEETTFELGTVLAARYRLEENLGATNTGCLFRAADLTTDGPICVLVLHRELTSDAASYTAIEREVEKVAKIEHPNLLRIHALETLEAASIITLEWVAGFSLLELLRARRELDAPEVLALLAQCAAGIDFATGAGVQRLNLELHQILIEFAGAPVKNALLVQSVLEWPAFTVKLNSLVTTHELSASETWAGAQTVVSGGAPREALEAGDETATIRALAGVAYELLGGSAGAGSSSGMRERYTPLASLSEGGNEVLRQALSKEPPFITASAFYTALAAREAPGPGGAVGLRKSTAHPAGQTRGSAASASAPAARVSHTPAPPPPRNVVPLLSAVVILFLLLLGAACWFFLLPDLREKATADNSPAPSVTDATSEPIEAQVADVPPPAPMPAEPEAPSRQELLTAARKTAEHLEEEANWPAAIAKWVEIARDFPEAEVSSVPLEMIIINLAKRPAAVNRDEFPALREPLTGAAQLNVVPAMKFLGDRLRKVEPEAAFGWLAAAAERGDLESLTQEGLMFSNGEGCAKDLTKATACLSEAAAQGHPAAMTAMGECYQEGNSVAKDEARAARLFMEAAEKGDARAMDCLGVCYDKGRGIAQDSGEAARWFTAATKAGHAGAYSNLGVLSMKGRGLPLSKEKAVEYFLKGAEGDDPTCMYYYALCVDEGTGTAASPSKARNWYAKAARAGQASAQRWCREHKVAF